MVNAPFAVIVDSTADIPADVAAARQVYTVPMHIIWDGVDYRDRIDMTPDAFYARLASAATLPTTSHPPLPAFEAVFAQAEAETGARQMVVLTISAQLSGAYNAACQAAKASAYAVHVVDTRTGSMAHGLIALALADARDAGMPLDAALRLAHSLTARTQMIFILDTLEYLYRSGRVSSLQRFLGNALRIKPVLHVREGGIALLEQVRTRQRMLTRLWELFTARVDPARPLRVGLLHGNVPDDLADFAARIQGQFQPELLITNTVCAPVAVHTGPGSLGFAILQPPAA